MNNAKREEVFIREFSIKDDVNVEHKCILAGVLEVETYEQPLEETSRRYVKEKLFETTVSWKEKVTQKIFNLGLSITNPSDKFNFELGKMIAIGRAKKPNKTLGSIISFNRSMLGSEMINAIMDQQVKFIASNKGIFLKSNGPVTLEAVVKSDDLPF